MMTRIALIAATAALTVTAAPAAAAPAVPFRTVAHGDGASSDLRAPGVEVLRSRREWRTTWRKLHAGVAPRPRLPRVNFSRHMLVLVTSGRRPTAGYGVTVTAIADSGRRLLVTAEERAPGRGCIVPQIETAPYHVVRVRRGRERVALARRSVSDEC